MPASKLILFVKAPAAGQVKTRLVPPLTHEQAAQLYRRWAQETYRAALKLKMDAVEVAYQPFPGMESPQWLNEEGSGPVPFFAQSGADLGDRMRNAFESTFKQGFDRVALVGTDSPGLPSSYIE